MTATQLSAWMPVSALAMIASLFAGCANTPAYEAPHVDAAPSTQALKSQQRKPGELIKVSIYEFHSAMPEIPVSGNIHMFKTALCYRSTMRVLLRHTWSD